MWKKVLLVIRETGWNFLLSLIRNLLANFVAGGIQKLSNFKRQVKNSAFHTGKLLGINAVCSSFCRTCTDYARVLVLQHKNKSSKDMTNYDKT
jgi:hypothetical protein